MCFYSRGFCLFVHLLIPQESKSYFSYLLQVNENKQIVEDKQDKEDQKTEETKIEPKADKKENNKKESVPDKTDYSDMTGQWWLAVLSNEIVVW